MRWGLRSKDRDLRRSGSANLERRVGPRTHKEWSPGKRFLRVISCRLRASEFLSAEGEFLDPKRVPAGPSGSLVRDRLRSKRKRGEFGDRAEELFGWSSSRRSRLGAKPEFPSGLGCWRRSRNGRGGEKERRVRSAGGSSTMTEPVPKFRNERGTKESKVAREACKNSWEDDRLEKSRQEEEGGADGGDPAN